jgi:hypothetical protein
MVLMKGHVREEGPFPFGNFSESRQAAEKGYYVMMDWGTSCLGDESDGPDSIKIRGMNSWRQ